MQLENEPLYIDLKDFASNHSLDLSVSPHDTFDDGAVYVSIMEDNEKVGHVVFRKFSIPVKGGYKACLNITWTVSWYMGMVNINGDGMPTRDWESGSKSDISNMYDILLNKTIPGQKRLKMDMKKKEIKKTSENWSLD